VLVLLERMMRGWHKPNLVEADLAAALAGQYEMAEMHRIERAAEHADFHGVDAPRSRSAASSGGSGLMKHPAASSNPAMPVTRGRISQCQ